MALTTAGLHAPALGAFEWSARNQRADGSWPMEVVGSEVTHASGDANQCAYIAVGVWHRFLITRDRAFIDSYWPVVRAAIDYVVDLQRADGAIHWSRDMHGVVNPDALLTGSACMVLSLRCAIALAAVIGEEQPEWELAAGRLAHSVAVHPDRFADKRVFAMDWYYPVLGGAVTGRGRQRITARWDRFVEPGLGVRCVTTDRGSPSPRPANWCWRSAPSPSRTHMLQVFARTQHLRNDDGSYWTGRRFPSRHHSPGNGPPGLRPRSCSRPTRRPLRPPARLPGFDGRLGRARRTAAYGFEVGSPRGVMPDGGCSEPSAAGSSSTA